MSDEELAPEGAAKKGRGKKAGGGKKAKGAGRPKSENPKVQLTLRLDNEIVEAFKAGGPGWQSRINRALRQSLRRDERKAAKKTTSAETSAE